MSTLTTRLRGLAATIALVTFMLGLPVLLLAIDAVPDSNEFSWSRLSTPDDGTLALQVIAIVCWIAWVIFTCQLIASIVSRIRAVRTPRLPGLVVSQLAADRLVAAAALLFVAVPTMTAYLPQPKAAAAVIATPLPAAPPAVERTAVTAHAPPAAPAKQEPATERYTVKRGDSLWKIAEERLGDGTRYVELVDLNKAVLGGRPGFLVPATVLKVPAVKPAPESESEYVVRPGDTLSEIAEDQLGDADAYPEIFEASRVTTQPDGQRLADPDLIRPGWRLTIPEGTPPQATPPNYRDHAPARLPAQTPPAETGPSGLPQPTPAERTATSTADSSADLPGWVLPGLAGGGLALAGALLLVLRQHRRTQLRYRRPGHIVAAPPPELRPVEKSAQASGSITAPQVECLDRALRSLGDPSTCCARLATAALSSSEIKLRLAAPAQLPLPWTGEGIEWTLRVADLPPERPDIVAPYPLLVSVGMAEHGELIFVNLEELRSAVLMGDADRANALARHIAAELSLSPWSQLVEIDAMGIGRELADIDPLRFHLHADSDTAFLDRLSADLEASDGGSEPDRYRALVAAPGAIEPEPVRRVAKIISSYTGRPGAAVITVDGEPDAAASVFELSSDGRLRIPNLGLDLTTAGLAAEEALACATLVDLTRDAVESQVPRPHDPTSPSDAAGALTAAYVEPRPKTERAGPQSLLPDHTASYTEASATTASDVETLAPLATLDAESVVRSKDPQLDDDLARWESPVLVAPKLTLLGPVAARTAGDSKQVAKRRPFYAELLAYLTLHPNGVTAPEVADAFGITKERARSDLSILRHWLGEDPRTGEPHLPDARAQRGRTDRGAVYATKGVLCDLDLFRRLRARGQADGEKGLDDLVTALRLVSGEPFSEHRGTGWGWLLGGERTDHIMTCAIVDVAHIVTTHALATKQLDLARFAAETAYRAAPYDETSRLDLIDVAAATGHAGAAQRQLVDDVLNRSDDGLGPIDVPDRTIEVMRQRGWSATGTQRERRA